MLGFPDWLDPRTIGRLLGAPQEIIDPLIEQIGGILDKERKQDPFQRDPEFIASLAPLLDFVNRYFGSELRGWENLPKEEPVLIVGNHSGGMTTIDPVPLTSRWIEERGCETPLYALAYDLLFAIPRVAPMLRKAGVLPASRANAQRALEKGASVIVFPGGDYEVFRPWHERNKIRFHGRMGFVELAIQMGVKVVPMTIHGAHESTFVFTRGHRFAKRAGLDRVHVKVMPLTWSLPFGPVPAFIPSIPLPSKVTVELDAPIDWRHFDAADAEDHSVLEACYDEIETVMQSRLDRMAEENPYPILTRLAQLNPVRGLGRHLSVKSFFS